MNQKIKGNLIAKQRNANKELDEKLKIDMCNRFGMSLR